MLKAAIKSHLKTEYLDLNVIFFTEIETKREKESK